jgi:hypothetical protein
MLMILVFTSTSFQTVRSIPCVAMIFGTNFPFTKTVGLPVCQWNIQPLPFLPLLRIVSPTSQPPLLHTFDELYTGLVYLPYASSVQHSTSFYDFAVFK